MSYIDTFDHSHVGFFLGIPTYHLLENIYGDDEEFSATPENLIIGGGSGEHPSLVIKNIDCCVLEYLLFLGEYSNNSITANKVTNLMYNWLNELPDDLSYTFNSDSNCEFYSWGMDDITNFTLKVNKDYSKAYKKFIFEENKKIKNKRSEEKVNILLGEFVYFHAQNLISDNLKNYLTEHDNEIRLLNPEPLFNSMEIAKERLYGRYVVSDTNGQKSVKQGLLFTDEYLIEKKRTKKIKNN